MAKESLKLQAYNIIKDKIVRCEYAPGMMLSEEILQEQIHASRTPIRDALSRLEQEGIIQILPKRGIMVSALSIQQLNMIFEVRLLFEPYAIEHYGNTIDDAVYRHYFDQLSHMKGNLADDEFYHMDDELHLTIMEAVPNAYMKTTYQAITTQNYRFRFLTGPQMAGRFEQTCEEHRAILRACLRHDWTEAAVCLREHIRQSKNVSFDMLLQSGKV